LRYIQLLSVISLLSSDKPNLDSPANVDAAKEVRTDFDGTSTIDIDVCHNTHDSYQHIVRRSDVWCAGAQKRPLIES
jgi:ubiquitin-protein ligase